MTKTAATKTKVYVNLIKSTAESYCDANLNSPVSDDIDIDGNVCVCVWVNECVCKLNDLVELRECHLTMVHIDSRI